MMKNTSERLEGIMRRQQRRLLVDLAFMVVMVAVGMAVIRLFV